LAMKRAAFMLARGEGLKVGEEEGGGGKRVNEVVFFGCGRRELGGESVVNQLVKGGRKSRRLRGRGGGKGKIRYVYCLLRPSISEMKRCREEKGKKDTSSDGRGLVAGEPVLRERGEF